MSTDTRNEQVVTLVAAYLSANPVPPQEISNVVSLFATEINKLYDPAPVAEPINRQPVVAVRNSIQPDYIVNLIDGRKLKSMKRYLRTKHNMSPQQYREMFHLPVDYPMVAPNYSAQRSALAKAVGLGRRVGKVQPAPAVAAKSKATTAPKRRGRPAGVRAQQHANA